MNYDDILKDDEKAHLETLAQLRKNVRTWMEECFKENKQKIEAKAAFELSKRITIATADRLISEKQALEAKLAKCVEALKHIQAMCGIPDAAEACRFIIKRADEALLDE